MATTKRTKAQPPKTPATTPRRSSPNRKLPPPTPSERALEAALAALRSGADAHPRAARAGAALSPRAAASPEAAAFVRRAFEKSGEYLHDRYASIGDATSFHTKIAGVSFEGRQDTIAGLAVGGELVLERQPDNAYDPNAIAVRYGDLQLGYVKKGIAAHIAPAIDGGARYRASIASLTGGRDKHRGVNIRVERDAAGTIAARAASARTGPVQQTADATAIRRALIGDATPHDAQRDVLDRIDRGANTLAVMGTGRGKSFCFQFAAAMRAVTAHQKTLVIYPLRALVNDQYEALARKLDPLGLRVYRANGAISNEEREELFEALREGAWDIVLATPEFLDFHRDAFRGASAPALLVVDEAHHVHESKHRAAYQRLGETIAALGNPQTVALTATAGDEAFARIVAELRIDAWVVDPTIRENLTVVDARNRKDKISYLADLFDERADDEKAIVYCNSRKEATDVANALRKRLSDRIVFYHAGMPAADRHQAERLFREGALLAVVATSAFGEGIDLPDVRDVVLYHLNFDFAEFNQQAGRAGRDGRPARIHLLYGENDRRLNDYLIDLDAPTLPVLRELYRSLKHGARDGVLRGSNADLASAADLDKVRDRTIAAALRIFSDSRLVEVAEDDDGRYVRFLPVDGKVDMQQNERFAEGEATRESFDRFCQLALGAPATTLERVINRPIYPSRVDLRRP